METFKRTVLLIGVCVGAMLLCQAVYELITAITTSTKINTHQEAKLAELSELKVQVERKEKAVMPKPKPTERAKQLHQRPRPIEVVGPYGTAARPHSGLYASAFQLDGHTFIATTAGGLLHSPGCKCAGLTDAQRSYVLQIIKETSEEMQEDLKSGKIKLKKEGD